MADRDGTWEFGGRRGDDRAPRGDDRELAGRGRAGEHRSFDETGRFNSDQDRYGPGSRGRRSEGGEPWRGEGRWGARYDQDRAGYREAPRFGGYAGQEYGLEAGREPWRERERARGAGGRNERESWRPAGGAPYGDLELNARNRGVQDYGAPHDYAYHPRQGHEFDPEYLSWREQQMRRHDRDYQAWRRAQQQRYDEDYRRSREPRRSQDHAAEGGAEFGREPPQVQAAASGWDARGAPEDRISRAREAARRRDEER
ncbi:MAG TPA: hypothetical protein VLI41_14365 [Phenylobacterium sp.]|uniref:hypothetical protein n=1 Tax=Phenylobacterium sp. TaxID=1871053 RepID=UPI002BE9DEC1|nr:hypothetical protein [Phenylobacterium sp.]HSV04376.1 hypothetical protein [Phenylobacterium sp.]